MKRSLKKVIDRKVCELADGSSMLLQLECGHTLLRGGPGRGGSSTFEKMKTLKKAKCEVCSQVVNFVWRGGYWKCYSEDWDRLIAVVGCESFDLREYNCKQLVNRPAGRVEKLDEIYRVRTELHEKGGRS